MNVFKKNKSETPAPLTQQMLTDITRGLQYAASTTNQAVIQQHLSLLDRFFDKDDDGNLHAHMATVQMDDKHHMQVPLIGLTHIQGLALDEMRVKLAVRLEQQATKSIKNNLENNFEQTRSAFSVSVQADQSQTSKTDKKSPQVMDIELTFKSCQAPEGLNRIVEEYTKLIQPIQTKGD